MRGVHRGEGSPREHGGKLPFPGFGGRPAGACRFASLIAVLSLGLAVTMARAQSDGGSATRVGASTENRTAQRPPRWRRAANHVREYVRHRLRPAPLRHPHHTVDPAFRAGDIGSLDLPSLCWPWRCPRFLMDRRRPALRRGHEDRDALVHPALSNWMLTGSLPLSS